MRFLKNKHDGLVRISVFELLIKQQARWIGCFFFIPMVQIFLFDFETFCVLIC